MKKLINTSIMCIILGCSAPLLLPSSVGAIEVTEEADDCAKEILLSYFPKPLVKETLKKFNIPENKWEGIITSLSSRDKEIIKVVEDKASKMNPNPLKNSQQRQVAVKLFRETLLEIFSNTLKENGITDQTQFLAMLDDIQQQKAKKFAMCMQKQKKTESTSLHATNSTQANENTEEASRDKEVKTSLGDEDDNDSDDDDDEDEDDYDDDEADEADSTPSATK